MHWIKNESAKNILATLCGLLIAFFAVEILLRIYSPFETRVKGKQIVLPVKRTYIIKNDRIPGIDKLVTHTRNSLGFRGSEPPSDFHNYFLIVTVWGSTTESNLISDGKTWPEILEGKLRTLFPKIWINNAGLDGHTTFGHRVLLEDYIIKLRPKMVVFLVGANDQKVDGLTEFDNQNIKRFGFLKPKRILRQIAFRSKAFMFVLNFYRSKYARKLGLPHHAFDFKKWESMDISQEQAAEKKNQYGGLYLDNYSHRLNHLIAECKKNSITPVLITQPMLWGKGKDKSSGIDLEKVKLGNMNGKLKYEILELYNDVTRNAGRKSGTLVIDLAEKLPKKTEYFYDTYHFTNVGSRQAADIIFYSLRQAISAQYPDLPKLRRD